MAVMAGLNDTRRNGSVRTEGEHESGANLMESGIYMGNESSTTEDTKSAPVPVASAGGRVSHPLVDCAVLGVGALHCAFPQRGSNTPSAADVTTIIVAVQTVIGLLGFWVAGRP